MQYAFEMSLAQAYSVDEAVFVHRLFWWVRDNAANRRNYHDGRYWTYDSMAALAEIFPCWSRRQLERIIRNCREHGLILTADFNADRRDRTTWYTVTDVVMDVYQSIPPDRGNAYHQMVQCTSPNGEASVTERGNVYKEHLEDQLEDERARARETAKKPDKPVRSAYGEFGNVRLSEEELDKLTARWTPSQVGTTIENLSNYMRSKGKRYADHYATLLNWLKRDYPPSDAPAGGKLIEEDWVNA